MRRAGRAAGVRASPGGPSVPPLPEGLGARVWRRLGQWSIVGGCVAWARWVARRPGSPPTRQVPGPLAAAGAEQQTPVSERAWGRAAGLWSTWVGVSRAFCVLGHSSLQKDLEAGPSTWHGPAVLHMIQLRQLLPCVLVLQGLIDPLPFKVLTGSPCLRSCTPEAYRT